jgi:hypothetical protein
MASSENDRVSTLRSPPRLKVSAFKDITAFLLECVAARGRVALDVRFVADADEAHRDLQSGGADLVFLSYDDCLSMALIDRWSDLIVAFPVHGGILDLCGRFDPTSAPRVGIDTETGYARALRLFLREHLGADGYARIEWVKAGATNLRYQRLRDRALDATLLNPPWSCRDGIARIATLAGEAPIPRYQGVVAALRRPWLDDAGRVGALSMLAEDWVEVVAGLRAERADAIEQIETFYGLSDTEADAVYARIWGADGLFSSLDFDIAALAVTERIFTADTGLAVPAERPWLHSSLSKG